MHASGLSGKGKGLRAKGAGRRAKGAELKEMVQIAKSTKHNTIPQKMQNISTIPNFISELCVSLKDKTPIMEIPP